MQQNVGVLDAVLRIGLGFGLIFTGFLLAVPMQWVAFAAAVILIITGFAGKCPLYPVLGINTCEASTKRQ